MDLKQLIQKVRQEGGTEIHLKIGSPPLMRQQKFLKRLSMPALVKEDIDQILNTYIKPDERKKLDNLSLLETNVLGTEPCNLDITVSRTQGNFVVIVRLLSGNIPTFEALRIPPAVVSMLERKSGLLIFSGPPRSGVNQTIAAVVERINQTRSAHILIIQDQIEYIFQSRKSRISQRQLKKDIMSFEAGINFAKRMDVDVLVIGDMKREPPLKAILDYVNGGHFAILSMQNLGVQATLEKIINSFSPSDREYVSTVLSQDLIGVCSQTILIDTLEQRIVPVHEVLVINPGIRKIIQQGKANQIEFNIKAAGEGSFLFEHDVPKAVKEGKIGKEVGDTFLSWYKGNRG